MNVSVQPYPIVLTIGVVGTLVFALTGVFGPILAAVMPTGADISHSQETVRAKEGNKVKNPVRKVAIVDDDVSGTGILIEFISLSQMRFTVKHFIDCGSLEVALESGTKFDLYVLDYYLDDYGNKLGTACIPIIRKFHPEALIVGRSGSDGQNPYQRLGIPWFNKMQGSAAFVKFMEGLF
jgi:hypothetical protein